MPDITITTLGLVLLIASIVAMICRRFDLPYSVGLVAAGIGLQLSPINVNLPLSRDLIFDIFLPPLVFEAALQLPWKFFKRNLPVTALLAFPGVVVAAAFVAAGMHYLIGWDWMGSLLFGTLMAATDPVSVIASFKELGVRPRLSLLVESESLAKRRHSGSRFRAAGGDPCRGFFDADRHPRLAAVDGGRRHRRRRRRRRRRVDAGQANRRPSRREYPHRDRRLWLVPDRRPLRHVGGSRLADRRARGRQYRAGGPITEKGRPHVVSMWQFAAFLANSIVFILIGAGEAHVPLHLFIGAAAIAVVLVLGGRALAVYPFCRLLRPTKLRVSMAYQHALFWGGLRGALGLALALALPPDLANRSEIIIVAFAVVRLLDLRAGADDAMGHAEARRGRRGRRALFRAGARSPRRPAWRARGGERKFRLTGRRARAAPPDPYRRVRS